jgi:hypothetical protein
MSRLNSSGPVPASPVASAARRLSLREQAECRLRSNAYLALRNVCCDDQDGVLILHGCVPSYYLKQVAQTVVSQVEGVQAIVNNIAVIAVMPGEGVGAEAVPSWRKDEAISPVGPKFLRQDESLRERAGSSPAEELR